MKTAKTAKTTNSFREPNEITRHFEQIWTERDDPDFKAKQKVKKTREDRMNKSDLGL